jgi:phosphatase NudJ
MSANSWKPNTTVAAVIKSAGQFLMIEEKTREGVRLNQPAGHLDPGESLIAAVAREALEETAYHVDPRALIGVYMSRYLFQETNTDVKYMRFTFACSVTGNAQNRDLDLGIIRALWMSPDEIRAVRSVH